MTENATAQVLTAGKVQELVYELKIEQAMVREVHTVTPENTMDEVRAILKEHKISGAPVVRNGMLVGIVSIEDLLKALVSGETKALVRDKMTSTVVTLNADEPLVHALNQFARYRFGRFPVVDRKTKKLVGILTKGDIVRCLLRKLEMNHQAQERAHYRPGHLFEDIVSDETFLVMRHNVEGSNFQKAGEASSRLKKNLLSLGLPPETVRRIAIASYEAEMNIVIFTPGGELVATVEPTRVTVQAVDKGPGIPDIEQAMQPGFSTAPDWVRELGFGAGMGLPNIKNNTDEMSLDSKVGQGTNLRFTVYTKRAA